MGKYLLTYTVPAQNKRRVVDAITPEEAIAMAGLRDDITDIGVTDLEDENADPLEVLATCHICGLAVWLTDELSTYTVTQDKDALTYTHKECAAK